MCKPASFVLTKDRVFWSKTSDSHEEIIREHSLCESVSGKPCIVRVEVTPPGDDFQNPEAGWVFRVDQDVLPEWFDREEAEKSVRLELKAWIKSKIVRAGDVRDVNVGELVLFVLSNGVVRDVWGNGVVQNVWGNGVVQNVRGNGVVQNVWGNGVVQNVRGNGVVQNVWDNGVVQDVCDNGVVQSVWGNGVVQNVWDNGVVIAYNSSAGAVVVHGERAVLIDRSGDKSVCTVGC